VAISNNWLLNQVELTVLVLKSKLDDIRIIPWWRKIQHFTHPHDDCLWTRFFMIMDYNSETESESDSKSPTSPEKQKACSLAHPFVPPTTSPEDLHHPHFEDVQLEIHSLLIQGSTPDLLAVRAFISLKNILSQMLDSFLELNSSQCASKVCKRTYQFCNKRARITKGRRPRKRCPQDLFFP